jgi:hypothetical protein
MEKRWVDSPNGEMEFFAERRMEGMPDDEFKDQDREDTIQGEVKAEIFGVEVGA